MDPILLEDAQKLLEKCTAICAQRRQAEEDLRGAATAHNRTPAQLREAVEKAKRWGVQTAEVEKQLELLHGAEERQNAAMLELDACMEADVTTGLADRLERAIRAAEAEAAPAEPIRAAVESLDRLRRHERRCQDMALEIRKAMPKLDKEPWRLIPFVERAAELRPWTAELESCIKAAGGKIDRNRAAQQKRKTAEDDLRRLVEKMSPSCGARLSVPEPEDRSSLVKAIEEAKSLGVAGELVGQAQEMLQSMRREGSRLAVAEHRLRLAMTSKDLRELERAACEVRSLTAEESGSGGDKGGGGASARRGKAPPQSTRLIDAANSMMKQLGDARTRREAAERVLQRHVVDENPGTRTAESVQELIDAVHEGKQSGVAPALLEQARTVLRRRRRHEQDRTQACRMLERSLAKNGAPTSELLHNLRRAQRFGEQE